MIGEFKIAESSVLVGQIVGKVCEKYNVKLLKFSKNLISNEFDYLQNIEAEYYLKVSGKYDNVVKLMSIASGG